MWCPAIIRRPAICGRSTITLTFSSTGMNIYIYIYIYIDICIYRHMCDMWVHMIYVYICIYIHLIFLIYRYTMKKAMSMGAQFASSQGDANAANTYSSTLSKIDSDLYTSHWTGTYIREATGRTVCRHTYIYMHIYVYIYILCHYTICLYPHRRVSCNILYHHLCLHIHTSTYIHIS
jgi:hypothetical protein